MIRWIMVLLVAATTVAVIAEARAIPAEPISMMLDAYGNPIVFLREKRTPVQPYPQRAMMFTGYYRPVRRSHAGQATGVFAQGNAVSGEAFFGGMHAPPRLHNGPAPVDEPEVSSAEAEAAPGPAEEPVNEEENDPEGQRTPHVPEEEHHHHHHHHQQEEEAAGEESPQEEERPQQEEEHHHQDEGHSYDEEEHHHHHHHQQHHHGEPEQETPQEEPENVPTEEAAVIPQATEAPVRPAKRVPAPPKKGKKTPVVRDEDEDDEDEDDEDDEPVVPFVPFKGNRRRQQYPHLNNFFPMVFSFPGVASRAGSSGSPPGTITAIANSYSTGKSGVASSMATAYGGSPNGKKRRTPTAEE